MTNSIVGDNTNRNQRSLQEEAALAASSGGVGASSDVPATASPPMAMLELVLDNGISQTDKITNDGRVRVSGIEEGASWQWSADGGRSIPEAHHCACSERHRGDQTGILRQQ